MDDNDDNNDDMMVGNNDVGGSWRDEEINNDDDELVVMSKMRKTIQMLIDLFIKLITQAQGWCKKLQNFAQFQR